MYHTALIILQEPIGSDITSDLLSWIHYRKGNLLDLLSLQLNGLLSPKSFSSTLRIAPGLLFYLGPKLDGNTDRIHNPHQCLNFLSLLFPHDLRVPREHGRTILLLIISNSFPIKSFENTDDPVGISQVLRH